MKKVLLFASLILIASMAAPLAHAGMIGSVTISELYPDSVTIYQGGIDTLAVGSSLSCPGASPLCASNYFANPATFSIDASTISLTEACCAPYNSVAFNGYSFTGITFADSGSIGACPCRAATWLESRLPISHLEAIPSSSTSRVLPRGWVKARACSL